MIEKNKLRIGDIEKKLSDVLDAVEIIRDNLPDSAGELVRMGLAKDGLYKKVEFAIESLIDVCNIINSDLRLGVPENEDDLLNRLESNKIFDKNTLQLIRYMKRFRNVLVHKYGDIDDNKAYRDISKGLDDFEAIIKEVEIFLDKHRNKSNKQAKRGD